MAQLASETLVLREQLMRNKLDSRTVGSALLATQEELKAAFNREQACEEGYNALLADLDSCRVNQERIGRPLPHTLVQITEAKVLELWEAVQGSFCIIDIFQQINWGALRHCAGCCPFDDAAEAMLEHAHWHAMSKATAAFRSLSPKDIHALSSFLQAM